MAVFARTRGGVAAAEFFGRDLKFIKFIANADIATGHTAVDSALERIIRATQMYGTVSLVGAPNSATVILIVEGLSNIGTAAALSTAANTALVGASRTINSVDIYDGISGATFA